MAGDLVGKWLCCGRGGRQLFAKACLCRLVGSRRDRQWKESAGVSIAAQPMQDRCLVTPLLLPGSLLRLW